MKRRAWLITPVLIFFSAFSTLAGEITLKNGDHISGRIVSESAELVIIETSYAGQIKIQRGQIEKIQGAEDEGAPQSQALVPSASTIVKASSNTNIITSPPSPTSGLLGTGFSGLFDRWEGNANIGFSLTSGNSKTTTMLTGLRAVKTGANDSLTVYMRSLWNGNRSSGRYTTTQNAFWGGARYDRNVGNRLFGFVSYDFERDRPKRLNFRSVIGGGLGRHSIKSDRTELDLLTGLAWNRTWQPGPNNDIPEALAGASLKHKLSDGLRLQSTVTYFQNVTDRSEYRAILDTTVSVDITKRVGFFITVGDRYNSDPLGRSLKNDFLFTTGMKWNFGKKK